ncbi:MAG: serine hydrolase domain-containing protein [Planctomycetaceae bacterium]
MLRTLFRIVTAIVSHDLCSSVFVSGLDADQDFAERAAKRPRMGLINWAVRYCVDRTRKEVTASIAGLCPSRAVYREGLGAIVVHPPESTEPPIATADFSDRNAEAALPEIAGPDLVEAADGPLRSAVDGAFAEPARPPFRQTKAVIVVHDGRVIAERYAPGCELKTRLLGYSDSKSVMSALVGILVRQGRLSVDSPAPVKEWADPDDPRHGITIDHLLRMTAGLANAESSDPLGPVPRMLLLERDMAAFAAGAQLEAAPGAKWCYSSCTTMILSRIVRDAVGGRAIDVLRFAHRELFQPLGMHDVTIEFDAAGTPIGSTYMYASARDWARFGLLYLNDGVVSGRRILSEGWVGYSSTPTLDTGYGAGFWTHQAVGDCPQFDHPWSLPGVPADAFSARGILGQYVIVVPSKRLVVARFGISFARDDAEGVGRLVAEVINALPGSV